QDPREADSTSLTLLDLAKKGNASAWRQLEFLYRPLVHWWCHQRGLGQEDAEDVIQEVFQAVSQGIPGFTKGPKGTFRGWLRGITRHKLADHYRRRGDEFQAPASDILEAVSVDRAGSSTEEVPLTEKTILVRRALELVRPEFRPQTWEASWRVVVEGDAALDVATALGMSVGAVYTAKSRVLARLREVLEDLQ